MNRESITNRANDNAYLKVMEDIDWDVFYEQKMALQDVTDYLHRQRSRKTGCLTVLPPGWLPPAIWQGRCFSA